MRSGPAKNDPLMKRNRLHRLTLAALLTAGWCLPASRGLAVPTIVNGGFETPAEPAGTITDARTLGVDGWVFATLGGEYVVSGNAVSPSGALFGTTPFGQQYLGLNGFRVGAPSVASQGVVGFQAGTTYAFTFSLADLNGATNPSVVLSLSSGLTGTGSILAQQTFTARASEGPYGNGVIDFVRETLLYTPTQDGAIDFSLRSVANGLVGIDNVSLAVVPEPGVGRLRVAGFGRVGGPARRRDALAMG